MATFCHFGAFCYSEINFFIKGTRLNWPVLASYLTQTFKPIIKFCLLFLWACQLPSTYTHSRNRTVCWLHILIHSWHQITKKFDQTTKINEILFIYFVCLDRKRSKLLQNICINITKPSNSVQTFLIVSKSWRRLKKINVSHRIIKKRSKQKIRLKDELRIFWWFRCHECIDWIISWVRKTKNKMF